VAGSPRKIVMAGDPVLHRHSRPVTDFGPELAALVEDLFASLAVADGVGLAAPQVGVDLAVFVYDCPDEDGVPHRGVVCNPELELPEGPDRRLDEDDEGCLSYPGAYVACARPDRAVVRGTDADGEPVEVVGTGLLARCLQHETDHLRGTVFGDRISDRARKKLRKQMEAAAADYPPDWPVGLDATPRDGVTD